MADHVAALAAKLSSRQARVCVVGLGYVGLPLAVAFADVGLTVTGIDSDSAKCGRVNEGESYIEDVPADAVRSVVAAGRLSASPSYAAVAEADAVTICVPTPLSKSKEPDISYVLAAAEAVVAEAHSGMLIVLESTTYPGTTDEVLLTRLRGRRFVVGQDVFLAYSPERVDPGNRRFTLRNTPKVIGGATPACLTLAETLYRTVVERVVPVSSPAAAEMVKILENTFRAVNIGLANEMAQICHRMGLDVWEVVTAAATKPFGFMPFYPGPGLGGHCIPVDPLYLTWKMRGLGMQTRFIELADVVNSGMPAFVARRVQDALNDDGKPLKGAAILVLGVAYKRDVSDVRESPALALIQELETRGAKVAYHDPHVPVLSLLAGHTLTSVELSTERAAEADCVIIHTDHSAFDWNWLGRQARLVFDTRNTAIPRDARARVVSL